MKTKTNFTVPTLLVLFAAGRLPQALGQNDPAHGSPDRVVSAPVTDPALELEQAVYQEETAKSPAVARLIYQRLKDGSGVPESIRTEAVRRLAELTPTTPNPAATADPTSEKLAIDVYAPLGATQVRGFVEMLGPGNPPKNLNLAEALFKLPAALENIRAESLINVPTDSLLRAAMDGIAKKLHPDARFLPQPLDRNANSAKPVKPFAGVGIIVSGGIEVRCQDVVPGSPADLAGVVAGCEIMKVDGRLPFALGGSLQDVVEAIRGPAGTDVTLQLSFPDGSEKSVTLTRSPLQQQESPVVSAVIRNPDRSPHWTFDPGVLAVHFQSTDMQAAVQLKKVMEDPAHQPVKALILDLRGNPGGGMSGTSAILRYFISGGVLYSRQSKTGLQTATASSPAPFADLPLAVLVDQSTGGSAEVIAAALQDHQRATIFGQCTSGHGTIFKEMPVPGGIIEVPVAELIRPSGARIQHLMGGPAWNAFQFTIPLASIQKPSEEKDKFIPIKIGPDEWGVKPDVVTDSIKRRRFQITAQSDYQIESETVTPGGPLVGKTPKTGGILDSDEVTPSNNANSIELWKPTEVSSDFKFKLLSDETYSDAETHPTDPALNQALEHLRQKIAAPE